LGLQDREYMHERHRNQTAPNEAPRPSPKRLKIQHPYPNLLSVALYLIVACIPVILYLQMPIPVNKPNTTLVSNKQNCVIGEIKLDANRDGVFSIADVRPLTLNIFSLPAGYVNSNNSLAPIAELFETRSACNGRLAAVFNGFMWLLGYVLLTGLLILAWNLTKLLLQLILFRILRISRSKKFINNIYWSLYPHWNFSMNFIFPIILCGGVMIVSIISGEPSVSSTAQQPKVAPPAAASITTRLENIKNLLTKGVITQSEYDSKKKEILNSF